VERSPKKIAIWGKETSQTKGEKSVLIQTTANSMRKKQKRACEKKTGKIRLPD